VLALPIVVQRLASDFGLLDLIGRSQFVNITEPLAAEATQRAPKRSNLAADDVGPELTFRSRRVSLMADAFRKVEHDCNRQRVVLTRDVDQMFPSAGLDIRSVDHRQLPALEPFASDVMQKIESIVRGRLIVLIIRNQATTEVG
jgi:hypothetical protein